jgi:hypothetical protein
MREWKYIFILDLSIKNGVSGHLHPQPLYPREKNTGSH